MDQQQQRDKLFESYLRLVDLHKEQFDILKDAWRQGDAMSQEIGLLKRALAEKDEMIRKLGGSRADAPPEQEWLPVSVLPKEAWTPAQILEREG